jgi:DNA-binding LacI/PurR family transcriptional regulator
VFSGKLGEEAVKRLIGLIRQEEVDSIVLPTEVIIRRSCGGKYL